MIPLEQEELLQEEDPFIMRIVNGFTGTTQPETEDLLFPDDREKTLSIWDDVDWWTGEAKGAPQVKQIATTTKQERELAEETFAQSTPGSSAAFQAAQAATGLSPEQWRNIQGGGESGDLSGFIPEKKLKEVPGFGLMKPDAAKNLIALKRAAKKAGHDLSGGAYRGYAAQVATKAEKGDLAATPGYSEHGWGMAIDIDSTDFGSAKYKWLMRNASKYGFVNPDWAQANGSKPEPWHWEWTGNVAGGPKKRRLEGRSKTERTVAMKGRKVGAQDLSSPVPMSEGLDFASALISLTEDDVEVETPRGKRRVNLAGVDKPKTTEEIVAYAKRVAKKYGWTDEEWRALYEIGQRESGWNPQADNPTSTASGIPQRLMSSHPFTQGEKQKWQDPRYQVRWFLNYIKGRYGDPSAALRHHDKEGWY